MLYCNPEFIVLFVVTLVAFLALDGARSRATLLLVASFVFYAWSGVLDMMLFIAVIVLSWGASALGEWRPNHRARFAAIAITIALAHLFVWKYLGWIFGELQSVFPGLNGGRRIEFHLPVGISFFTLQAVAYLVDYGRGNASFMSLPRFALYKAFFPQLVAGPIVRPHQLAPQLDRMATPTGSQLRRGAMLFSIGLVKKLVIADRISAIIDQVFTAPSLYGRHALFLSLLGYTVQIWADFSGYTDMGRGCARMLGIELPENFKSPYLSRSPSEFWRRWHITLSEWIRDFVYLPLGGNRGSLARRISVVCLTMAISGMWHGAAWTFVLWGLYHGVLMVIERGVAPLAKATSLSSNLRGGLGWLLTQTGVVFGWLLFRASSMHVVGDFLRGLAIDDGTTQLAREEATRLLGMIAFCAVFHVFGWASLDANARSSALDRTFDRVEAWADRARSGGATGLVQVTLGAAIGLALLLIVIARAAAPAAPFIYFRF